MIPKSESTRSNHGQWARNVMMVLLLLVVCDQPLTLMALVNSFFLYCTTIANALGLAHRAAQKQNRTRLCGA